MSKVFLGVGHGGKDPGAVGYIKEADVNLQMALACRDYLEANGVKVKMSRTKDENDDLNEEIKECNNFAPDLAVDIHNNAGGGDGFEGWYSIKNDGSKELIQNIEKEIKSLGQNSRGCKTRKNSAGNADYYGFIRLVKCKSVITEAVFVDNKKDAAQADTLSEQKAFGIAIAKGILKTLNIKAKTPTTSTTPKFKEYKVKITTKELNVREKASMGSKVVTTVKKDDVYTIVEEKKNGDTKWLKLKSGKGYISSAYTKKV